MLPVFVFPRINVTFVIDTTRQKLYIGYNIQYTIFKKSYIEII